MSAAIRHRGPDDDGILVEPQSGLALAHRRLSILDLSPHGHQPMLSARRRYVIVYNGEVYNFAELRRELEDLGYGFRGHCDTEIILAAFEELGVHDAVRRFIGMFAFALWDRVERKLYLVRDRLGIKPLYFGWAGRALVFGSELKALRAHPDFRGELDETAVVSYLCYGYVPAPLSIFRNIYKLPPGTILEIPCAAVETGSGITPSPEDDGARVRPVRYWSAREIAERGCAQPLDISEDEACERLDLMLRDAIRLRMLADVPVGAFLSGGIDSSTIAALMQRESGRPIKTFTVAFSEKTCNEGDFAAAVANYLGTDHTELHVTYEEALSVMPRLPVLCDEPNADGALLPAFLISELARKTVTVSLSGEGGDELFGGYHRYFYLSRISRTPILARRILSGLCKAFSGETWDRIFNAVGPLFGHATRIRLTGDKPYRLGRMMEAATPEQLLVAQVAHWNGHPLTRSINYNPPLSVFYPATGTPLPDASRESMYLDLITYLPDALLAKTDRTSMAASLEARLPLLDHRVVEFAWRLPMSLKLRNPDRKYILRKLLYKYVPRQLVDRPKKGFGVPIDTWICGPLRDWAESLLDAKRLRQAGYYDVPAVRSMWHSHLLGNGNWSFYIWPIIVLEAWKEHSR